MEEGEEWEGRGGEGRGSAIHSLRQLPEFWWSRRRRVEMMKEAKEGCTDCIAGKCNVSRKGRQRFSSRNL